jgi:hypothetical protein
VADGEIVVAVVVEVAGGECPAEVVVGLVVAAAEEETALLETARATLNQFGAPAAEP